MVTFLIISKNQTTREQHATDLINQQQIHLLDVIYLETEGTIGIEDVRNLQKKLMLKPLKGTQKAAIIKNAHTLTIEAQNALLKTLEEPPANTSIFLTAETSNTLLPTILSRTAISILQEEQGFTDQELTDIHNQLETLVSETIGNRLKLAEVLAADKPNAILWLEKALYILRNKMFEEQDMAVSYVPVLQSLQKTHTILKTTNVNPRFALENLFLNIYSSSFNLQK